MASQRQLIVSIAFLQYLVSKNLLKDEYGQAANKILGNEKLLQSFMYCAASRFLGRCVPNLPDYKNDINSLEDYEGYGNGYQFCNQATTITRSLIDVQYPGYGRFAVTMGETFVDPKSEKLRNLYDEWSEDEGFFSMQVDGEQHDFRHHATVMNAILESVSLMEGQRLLYKQKMKTDRCAINKCLDESGRVTRDIKNFWKEHREMIRSDQNYVLAKITGKYAPDVSVTQPGKRIKEIVEKDLDKNAYDASAIQKRLRKLLNNGFSAENKMVQLEAVTSTDASCCDQDPEVEVEKLHVNKDAGGVKSNVAVQSSSSRGLMIPNILLATLAAGAAVSAGPVVIFTALQKLSEHVAMDVLIPLAVVCLAAIVVAVALNMCHHHKLSSTGKQSSKSILNKDGQHNQAGIQ